MKIFTFLILFIITLSSSLFAQTNSVALKDGGGSVIGMHNSIQSAIDAIPATITQAYVIEIETIYTGANETIPIQFTVINGTSASNTITLRPAAGNTGEVITGSSTNSIIRIEGINFVIIDGRPGGTGSTADLKIINTATSGSNAHNIEISNSSSNNVIRYVHLQNLTANSAGPRTIEIGPTVNGITGNDNNIIEYCEIEGGRSGVGLAGSTGFTNDDNIIRNCKIYNFGYAGIWILSGSNNTTVEDNELYSTMPASTSTILSGIVFGATAGGTNNIVRNKIYNLESSSTSTGLDVIGILFQGNQPDGSVFNINNNFISLPLNNNNTQATNGIELDGTGVITYNVYYNSIRIGGTQTGGTGVVSACIFNEVTGVSANVNIKNNICVNNRTGGATHAGGWYQDLVAILNINYNDYYVDGTGGVNAIWGATPYTVLATYKAAATPQEQNSAFRNVTFVSTTDLHLSGSSIGDTTLKGMPIAGITEDIDGDLRNSLAPYMGADEGDVVLNVLHNSNIASSYSLSQNYPNPFNPTTSINFSIPKAGFVTLKIYDVTGKEVAALVNEELNTGAYNLQFNGSKLSSGVYFYSINAGSFTETKQMLLVK